MENKITENTEPLENPPRGVWVDVPGTKGKRIKVTPEEAEALNANPPRKVWVEDPTAKEGRKLVDAEAPEEAETLKLSEEEAENKQLSDKVLFPEKSILRA